MRSLGIAVSRSSIRMMLVRGKEVVWHACASVDGQAPGDALDALLATLPVAARPGALMSPRVVLAVGAGYVQVKRLEGLPATDDQRMLTTALRLNSAAFFLRGSARLIISDVDHRPDGSNWSAAYHGDVIDELVEALRRRRMPKLQTIPAVVARARLLGAGAHVSDDDGVRLEVVSSARGIVTSIRRVASDTTETVLPPALADIGAEYLDAYAAATAGSTVKLSWRPPPEPRHARRMDAFRFALAGALLATTLTAALIAPGMRAGRDAISATTELDRYELLARESGRVRVELSRVSAQLDRIDRFQKARGKTTKLIGAISAAIPDSTAVVTLRVDSVEGSFVVLTPRAADVLSELASTDGIVSPKIAGSVTREMQGSARLERATVRFRRALGGADGPITRTPRQAGRAR
jgi:hypothetical protein